ncbi:hypothetical protein GN244_ATG08984 [Phytophthora infestans]|uniref:Uncharacterized protein n=1 Tax=Phytophthora infestans TaxID=4787 RepID=A0A833SW47_PHYIN|nr:hypothetical protein GN244_ATG08984 [Phytophthora infestans]KAF4142069.1 hypothetical protein GN958_ATG08769 [Phytophthora infestans]
MAATESFVAPLACSQPESHGKVKTFLTSSQFETHCKVRTPVKVAVNSVVGMLVKAVVASEVWADNTCLTVASARTAK